MKKKLLKPPQDNSEIIVIPSPEEIISHLNQDTIVGVCHQPYFFNPGVSLKFLFLEYLPKGREEILFLDTDKVRIEIKVPSQRNIETVKFIESEEALFEYPTPAQEKFNNFFSLVEEKIKIVSPNDEYGISTRFTIFKEILLRNQKKRFLKEVLGESFLQFHGIKRDYKFLSEVIKDKEFEDFFLHIYKDDIYFRKVFNQSLDDYRNEFRFRYKNFPFPKLKEGELPFWIIKEGKRVRCFKKDLEITDFKKLTVFPRASTLTIFLRLYKLNLFIHGVGGANYEWVQDRVIERFFKHSPPFYGVVSGTFLIGDWQERRFPYFFFAPQTLRKKIEELSSFVVT